MKRLNTFLLIFLSSFLFSGLGYSQINKGDFLTRAIDKSVNPGTDFFKYATGTWMKNNPIPPSERAWGIGNLVQEETYTRLKGILEDAENSNAPQGSNEQKIGDFYFSGMDSAGIEKQGISPLLPYLKMIDAVSNKEDLFKAAADLQSLGIEVMFELYVDQDAKNSDKWAMYLWQGGLGLPNRDYYFRTDSRTENIRTEYKSHVSKMLSLIGEDQSVSSSDENSAYQIETFLADSSRKLADLRDPYANYNKMTIGELQKLTPSIDWNLMMNDMGAGKLDTVIVGQPGFYKQLDAAVNKFTLDQWKAYLKWHLINSFASRLSSPFEEENFHFHGTVMTGVKEQKPRWKRVLAATQGAVGELLGQVYVKKYYSPKTKKRYEKLVDDIIASFRERIKKLDWMSEATKKKALFKLNAIKKKVGYPDKWKDFSKLTVSRKSFAENTIMARKFWFSREINKLFKPVDRTEWGMTPQTYNAYYNPSNNEIVLPAAIFIVPGVPDSLLDDAVVYSYAGASTIGHELTHGFDDQGRLYDADGNLADWWTKKDNDNFKKRVKLIVEQFNNYVVLDSMHINGEATQGENLADLGGLLIGYDAFKKTEEYKSGKKINGFTPSQRFWLGYAYSWLGHMRPETLARQVMTDVHSPNFLRVNGPFSDIPAFYKAFNIKPGEPMYRPPDKRVKVW